MLPHSYQSLYQEFKSKKENMGECTVNPFTGSALMLICFIYTVEGTKQRLNLCLIQCTCPFALLGEGKAGEHLRHLEETVRWGWWWCSKQGVWSGNREVEENMGWRIFLHPPSCAFQEPGKHWGKEETGTGLAGPWVRKYESPGVQLSKLLVLRSFWVTIMEVLQCCWAVCWENNPSAFN